MEVMHTPDTLHITVPKGYWNLMWVWQQ